MPKLQIAAWCDPERPWPNQGDWFYDGPLPGGDITDDGAMRILLRKHNLANMEPFDYKQPPCFRICITDLAGDFKIMKNTVGKALCGILMDDWGFKHIILTPHMPGLGLTCTVGSLVEELTKRFDRWTVAFLQLQLTSGDSDEDEGVVWDQVTYLYQLTVPPPGCADPRASCNAFLVSSGRNVKCDDISFHHH
jgi:hypothetical protein